MSAIIRPNIFEYDNVEVFLTDMVIYFKHERQINLSKLNSRAGFASKGYLNLIMNGERKLGEEFTAKLASALELSKAEAQHFELLVKLSRPENSDQIEQLRKKLHEEAQYRMKLLLEDSKLSFCSKWYMASILEFIRLAPKNWSTKALAESLGINTSEVQDALSHLKLLGLIAKAEDGSWMRTRAVIESPKRVPREATLNYTMDMLEKASAALNKQANTLGSKAAQEKQDFNSLTIALSDRQYSKLSQKIWAFLQEINEEVCEVDESVKVYQMNLQLFGLLDPQSIVTYKKEIK